MLTTRFSDLFFTKALKNLIRYVNTTRLVCASYSHGNTGKFNINNEQAAEGRKITVKL